MCPSKLLFLLSLKLEVSHVTRERFAKVNFFVFFFFCKKLHSMQPAMCAIWREWFSLITMIWHFLCWFYHFVGLFGIFAWFIFMSCEFQYIFFLVHVSFYSLYDSWLKMQVLRHISLGMLVCTCLIGYSQAASLSLLMPGSSRLSANGQHTLSTDTISSSK